MTGKAGPTGTVSPEVLAAASSCPYIQRVVVEVGDPQLVSNSLGPFLTLASTTSLADPVGASGASATEEAAAAAAAADAAASADAEEAAERAAHREAASPPSGPPCGQAPSSLARQHAAGPQPQESPPDQHAHSSTPAPAGKPETSDPRPGIGGRDMCDVDPAQGVFDLASDDPLFAHEPGVHSHMSEECLNEDEVWLLVLLATP